MVPRRGVEPLIPYGSYDLNVVRLPIPPPRRRGVCGRYYDTRQCGQADERGHGDQVLSSALL